MQKTYRWEGDKVYFNAKINFFNNSILFKNGENITFGPFFGPSFTRRIAYGKEGPKKKVEGPKKFWSCETNTVQERALAMDHPSSTGRASV